MKVLISNIFLIILISDKCMFYSKLAKWNDDLNRSII
jgi:hypothetical protein